MRSLLLLALPLATACGDTRLEVTEGALLLEPASVSFPATPVGGVTSRVVTVRNTTRQPLHAAAHTDSPFAVEGRSELPASAALELTVRFTPAEEGRAEGWLEVGGQRVKLIAYGVSPCGATACAQVKVDEETGECIRTSDPDDTPCATACVAAGRCSGGECLGPTETCDDGDPCTMDACDADSGCVQLPFECAPPENPCLSAVCHSQQGCVTVPVTDGTSCGKADCVSSSVCIQGACVERPPPDGAPCSGDSPCRPGGTCQSQQCIQPAATPLSDEWSWHEPNRWVVGAPVMDPHGNLYFLVVLDDFSSKLMGLSRDGQVILDVDAGNPNNGPLLWESGLLIYGAEDSIRAVDPLISKTVWYTRFGELSLEGEVPDTVLYELAGDALWSPRPGELGVIVAADGVGSDLDPYWSLRLDARTGALKEVGPRRWGFGITGGYADESGQSIHSYAGLNGHRATVAEDLTAAPLWEAPGAMTVGMAGGGRLVSWHQDGQCQPGLSSLDAATGSAIFLRDDLAPFEHREVVILRSVEDALFAVTETRQPLSCENDPGHYLARIDPQTGATVWQHAIASELPRVMPTDSKTLLFIDKDLTSDASVLKNVTFDGEVRWHCELESPWYSTWYSSAMLHEGRLFFAEPTSIRAVDVPGLDLSPTGWVTQWGDPQHRRRPR